MNNEEGYKLLYHFASAEWSTENLQFHYDYLLFCHVEKPQQKLRILQFMFDNYLAPNCLMQLNVSISPQLLTTLEAALKSNEIEKLNQIFEDFDKQAIVNISDTFSRFSHTKQYIQWKEQESAKKDAYEKLGWNQTAAQSKRNVKEARKSVILNKPLQV